MAQAKNNLGLRFMQSSRRIMVWEQRLADIAANGSPPAPPGTDVTVEADELYGSEAREPLTPSDSEGWTFQLTRARLSRSG